MKNLLYQFSKFWGKLSGKQKIIFIGVLVFLSAIGNCSNPNSNTTNSTPEVVSPTPSPTPTPSPLPEINPAFRLDNTISQNSDNSNKPKSIASNVRAACRMRVNQDLIFPETAKHGLAEPGFIEANKSWEYRSNVISKNDLGGETTTEYYCIYDDGTGEMSILYGEG